MMRNELLRMLSWQVGSTYGFTFSVGKNYKFIDQYLPAEQCKRFFPRIARILWKTHGGRFSPATNSFEMPLKNFAAKYGYTYPDYDENVSRYVRDMYAEYEAK